MKDLNTTNVEISVPNREGMFFISITNGISPSFAPGQTSISFSPSTISSSSVSPCTTTASPSFRLFSSSPVSFNVICPSPVSSESLVSQQSSIDSLSDVTSNASDTLDNNLNYMEIEMDVEEYEHNIEMDEEETYFAMDIEDAPILIPSATRSSSVRRYGKGGKCPKKPSRLPSL